MNRFRNLIIGPVLIVILLTSGCMVNAQASQSTPVAAVSIPAKSSPASVRGLISYPVLAAFMPRAVLTVQLVDISSAASPAIVLDELHIRSKGQPAPFEFDISYDPTTIKPDGMYSLLVSVTVDGNVLYRSSNKLSMGMQGNTQPMKVTLSPVGSLTMFDEAIVEGRLAHYSY